MNKLALIFVASGLLLLGASACTTEDTDDGTGGSAGSAGKGGSAQGGDTNQGGEAGSAEGGAAGQGEGGEGGSGDDPCLTCLGTSCGAEVTACNDDPDDASDDDDGDLNDGLCTEFFTAFDTCMKADSSDAVACRDEAEGDAFNDPFETLAECYNTNCVTDCTE